MKIPLSTIKQTIEKQLHKDAAKIHKKAQIKTSFTLNDGSVLVACSVRILESRFTVVLHSILEIMMIKEANFGPVFSIRPIHVGAASIAVVNNLNIIVFIFYI